MHIWRSVKFFQRKQVNQRPKARAIRRGVNVVREGKYEREKEWENSRERNYPLSVFNKNLVLRGIDREGGGRGGWQGRQGGGGMWSGIALLRSCSISPQRSHAWSQNISDEHTPTTMSHSVKTIHE